MAVIITNMEMQKMTRKEAIEILKHEKDNDIFVCTEWRNKIHEAIEMAISSLETDEAYQLEYERTTKNDLGVDAVSRQAVLNTLERMDKALDTDRTVETYKELLKECYKVLPSVTPQEPKTGHWIDCDNSDDYSADGYDCSVCGVNAEYATSYCPNCGARMVDEQPTIPSDKEISDSLIGFCEKIVEEHQGENT